MDSDIDSEQAVSPPSSHMSGSQSRLPDWQKASLRDVRGCDSKAASRNTGGMQNEPAVSSDRDDEAPSQETDGKAFKSKLFQVFTKWELIASPSGMEACHHRKLANLTGRPWFMTLSACRSLPTEIPVLPLFFLNWSSSDSLQSVCLSAPLLSLFWRPYASSHGRLLLLFMFLFCLLSLLTFCFQFPFSAHLSRSVYSS